MKTTGRVLIFTGDGKGKTTAALGMALRASGHGMKVCIIQFIKSDEKTGEAAACRHLQNVEIRLSGLGFLPDPADRSFSEHCRKAREGLDMARQAFESGRFHMIVLDEICFAVAKGVLDEQSVIEALNMRQPETHLVMTGRNATAGLIDLADTVTEMRLIKHGFSEGMTARQGVEY